MSDDKTKRDGRETSKVSGSESYELAYLEEKLGVTRQQVQHAIRAVGNDRVKVEYFLKK